MRVILFGATGMVGQGLLRECVRNPTVEAVLSVVRRLSVDGAAQRTKVRELVADDFYDFSAIESEFAGYDACFFVVGVSAIGMKEPEYRRVTYDIAVAAGAAVAKMNPEMTLVHGSAAGADSTEKGRAMWARVKGETENAMLRMPVKAVYVFRPFLIVPMHGIRSKTGLYNAIYGTMRPVLPVLLRMFPKYVTTTEQLGRAMLRVAKYGYPKQVLESVDIASA
jgi:uncharacterized protein YbjT (DUF2867 family)